jgi:hypothetical protein
MKHAIWAIAAAGVLLSAKPILAQETNKKNTIEINKKEELTERRHKKGTELSITNKGIRVRSVDTSKEQKAARMIAEKDGDDSTDEKGSPITKWAIMFDLGLNTIKDNTNYASPEAKAYLNVPTTQQNASLFDLRPAKSINVNIYPWMIKFRALKTHGQRIYISSGIGLQLYNFRYENPLNYTRSPKGVILDTLSFKKDKLGIDYLNIPLMFTFKTRLHKSTWLVYGAGITEGFRLDSWNKQVSSERGKVKVHNSFGLADWNTCITGEIGIEGIVRLYASYQVTSMYQTGLDQHPISFGLRFAGM